MKRRKTMKTMIQTLQRTKKIKKMILKNRLKKRVSLMKILKLTRGVKMKVDPQHSDLLDPLISN